MYRLDNEEDNGFFFGLRCHFTEEISRTPDDEPQGGSVIEFGSDLQKLLAYAAEVADQTGSKAIATRHLIAAYLARAPELMSQFTGLSHDELSRRFLEFEAGS
jgi:hypothetical protein